MLTCPSHVSRLALALIGSLVLAACGDRAPISTDEQVPPLLTAAEQGDLAALNELLAHGADPSLPGFDGRTAADWARAEGHAQVLAQLEARAPSPHQQETTAMGRSVAVSARIPIEDAEFISQLQVEGARTPSDKLRSVIAEARRRHEGARDYGECLTLMRDLLTPTQARWRTAELAANAHSEPLGQLLEWLPDIAAFLMSGAADLPADPAPGRMQAFERGATERTFRLIEAMLRMGVTPRCPCYDPGAIIDRVDAILALSKAIDAAIGKQAEEEAL